MNGHALSSRVGEVWSVTSSPYDLDIQFLVVATGDADRAGDLDHLVVVLHALGWSKPSGSTIVMGELAKIPWDRQGPFRVRVA